MCLVRSDNNITDYIVRIYTEFNLLLLIYYAFVHTSVYRRFTNISFFHLLASTSMAISYGRFTLIIH